MELLETVSLFLRRNHSVLHCPADDLIGDGRTVLSAGFCDDHIYHCEKAPIWRSGIRMAFAGLHYSLCQRHPVFLCRNTGTVSGKGIYGGKETPDLCAS